MAPQGTPTRCPPLVPPLRTEGAEESCSSDSSGEVWCGCSDMVIWGPYLLGVGGGEGASHVLWGLSVGMGGGGG